MISIVIPTYNEKENIRELIDTVFRNQSTAHVVVVDDNSPDGTASVVKKMQKKQKRLYLLIRKKEKGRGASVIDGFSYVMNKLPGDRFIIEMDSDFSHNPADIAKLLKKKGKKIVVIGSRYVHGSKIIDWPRWRLILSKISNWYIRLVLRAPINDYTMGFRCYSRDAIKILLQKPIQHKGFITLSETAYRLHQSKFQFIEVPITLRDRTKGRSNATFFEVIRSFVAIVQIRLST